MKSSRLLVDLENLSLKPGGIVACSGASLSSDFINVVTYGCPRFYLSHLMILAEYRNELLLFESNDECAQPCVIRGKGIKGTQAHRIGPRLRGYRGKVWYYELAKPLRPWERKALTRYLTNALGRSYDTLGATRSGGKIWSYIQKRLHQESLESLFCSEWVAASLKEIERFDTLSASQWSPNSLIRECNRRGMLLPPRRLK